MSWTAILLLAIGTLAAPALSSPRVRFIVFVLGGYVIFQGSAGGLGLRGSYLLLIAATLLLERPMASWDLVTMSGYLGLAVVLLAGIALVRGNLPTAVFRDTSGYVILIAAAPLSVRLGARISERLIFRVALATSLAGTYSFTAHWMNRRALAALPEFGLSSSILVGLLVVLSASKAQLSSRPAGWWTLSLGAIAAGLLTGTRSMFALILPLAVVIVRGKAGSGGRANVARLRGLFAAAAFLFAATWGASLIFGNQLPASVQSAATRLSSFSQALSGGGAASQSIEDRRGQQALASESLNSSPLIGVGPGTIWPVRRPGSRIIILTFTLDTPVVTVAKFGLLGGAMFALLLYHWLRQFSRPASGMWGTCGVATLWFALTQCLSTAPLEDRGLALSLLAIGCGIAAQRTASENGSELATDQSSGDRAARDTRYSARNLA
jgi:hypothetical protein